MDPQLFEQLLHEEESTSLDFRREQYAFANSALDGRAELLKDVLGFSNSWRRVPAYILIGVHKTRGARGEVVGVTHHLDDHSLRHFVNNLAHQPLHFGYEQFTHDGKPVGVLRVDLLTRPVFLKRDFGPLKRNEVYVRRGASTDLDAPAMPHEIAQMGRADRLHETEVSIDFATLDRDESLGTTVSIEAEYCTMPDRRSIPDYSARSDSFLAASATGADGANPDYWRELAENEFCRRLFRPMRMVVQNTGRTAARDVHVELSIPTRGGVSVCLRQAIPPRPRKSIAAAAIVDGIQKRSTRPGALSTSKTANTHLIEAECGFLQPGRKVFCDPFWIGNPVEGLLEISGQVFATNFEQHTTSTLLATFVITKTELSLKELFSLGDDEQQPLKVAAAFAS